MGQWEKQQCSTQKTQRGPSLFSPRQLPRNAYLAPTFLELYTLQSQASSLPNSADTAVAQLRISKKPKMIISQHESRGECERRRNL